jgi:hypothetical protein
VSPRFPEFNEKIKLKIMEKHGVIPEEANDVALWVDGSRFGIGKASDYAIQREWYNFKYGHNAGI